MGRLLGPADYGILASLIALFSILAIPSQTLNIVVVKFVSHFKAKNNYLKIGVLFDYFTRRLFLTGFLIFVAFSLSSVHLTSFLKIPSPLPVVVLGPLFLFSFLVMLNRSILQGMLKFELFALTGILEVFLKIGLAILLIFLGFSVLGAILAIVLAEVFVYFVTFLPIKYRFLKVTGNTSNNVFSRRELLGYSLPVFIATFSMVSFYSSDVILVKHFFTPLEAGLYSSLSVMGRVIFFASAAVALVMFPVVSEKYSRREKYHHFFYFALSFVLAISAGILAFYFLIPSLVVRIFFGQAFVPAAPFLAPFGLFMLLFSLANIFVIFFLATNKIKIAACTLFAALTQVILIVIFHSSLLQVIMISILTASLLLLSLMIYFVKNVAFSYRSRLPSREDNL